MAGSMGRVAGSAVVVAAAAKGIRFMGEEEPQGGWGCEGGVRESRRQELTYHGGCMCIFWAILLVLLVVGVVEVRCFCCCATATWSVCVKKNGQICTPHLPGVPNRKIKWFWYEEAVWGDDFLFKRSPQVNIKELKGSKPFLLHNLLIIVGQKYPKYLHLLIDARTKKFDYVRTSAIGQYWMLSKVAYRTNIDVSLFLFSLSHTKIFVVSKINSDLYLGCTIFV